MTDPDLFSRYHPIIDDIAAFEACLYRPLPRFLWTNTLRSTAQQLLTDLLIDGFEVQPLKWYSGGFKVIGGPGQLGNHWTYLAGHFQIQEASSMLPVMLLDPQPGERVLDMCAAPGNKTAQIAVALGNHGTVVANDPSYSRMRSVRMHIDRLGLLNVSMTCDDGGSYPKAAGLFDAALVDAPCSCEGTSRINPNVIRRLIARRSNLIHKQKMILLQAIRRTRPGGCIVYSTCTYAPEENEAVVNAMLREMPDAIRIRPAILSGYKTAPGLTQWNGDFFDPDLQDTLRIWPHHNNTGGFYVAVLEKCGPGTVPEIKIPAISDSYYKSATGKGPHHSTEADSYIELLTDRYGIDTSLFNGIQLLAKSKREIYAVAADHRPPLKPVPTAGLPLLHRKMRYPKLTTAGAAMFGRTANRNLIDVNETQLEEYVSRRPFTLDANQKEQTDGSGHVLIRYRDSVLGVGDYHRQRNAVESFFPKHLAGRSDI